MIVKALPVFTHYCGNTNVTISYAELYVVEFT